MNESVSRVVLGQCDENVVAKLDAEVAALIGAHATRSGTHEAEENAQTATGSESKMKDAAGNAVGVAAGAGVGGYLGSSIGIVALGGGITGIVPLTLLGGYAGYRVAKGIRNRRKRRGGGIGR